MFRPTLLLHGCDNKNSRNILSPSTLLVSTGGFPKFCYDVYYNYQYYIVDNYITNGINTVCIIRVGIWYYMLSSWTDIIVYICCVMCPCQCYKNVLWCAHIFVSWSINQIYLLFVYNLFNKKLEMWSFSVLFLSVIIYA